jgi:sodium-dependent phosphate transporter
MAPAISAGFAATIFMLIKLVVHMRKNPVPWAIYTSPFFFLIAGTICTLSIVYKGSPNLGLNKKPSWYIAAVTLGVGAGLCILSAIFFVPYVYSKVLKRDQSVRGWQFIMGPALLKRPVQEGDRAKIPNYAVVQHDEDEISVTGKSSDSDAGEDAITSVDNEKALVTAETQQKTHKELVAEGEERLHAKLRKKSGPIGWAMRTLHENPIGPGQIYEWHNVKILAKRIPAMITCGALYGLHYDIHASQTGTAGTPDGDRMARVYAAAEKYPNEVEHTYSFVQILTACTASFAHGANDIGNSVGPWAVIYSAWNTGNAAASKAPVPVWQLAVLSAMISLGLITYGYNIMKGMSHGNSRTIRSKLTQPIVMGNKITYHSPSRGSSMEMGAAITVLVFSQFSLPVSTSMCITGATVGVGLCNGTYKAVNWQRVGLLVFSWIMTIPVAGTIGGVLMGVVLNAPHFKS